MLRVSRKLVTIFMLLIACALVEGGLNADYADAKSKFGGRSFSMTPRKAAPAKTVQPGQKQGGSTFGRGLAGGLLGGALGGMLFGSMFGAGGTGMGILPILLLAGGAFFLYKKMQKPQQKSYQQYSQSPGAQDKPGMFGGGFENSAQPPPPPTPDIGGNLLDEGVSQIRETDKDFDPNYFVEVASDVFFQVQAGWMRRDLSSYRHLLGDQLAGEYEKHFEEMREKGHINKLESIAVRGIEVVQAGSDGREDFVTVRFTANLLDYTVDDKTGDLIDGSMTTPIKFEENWSWARPTGTQDWKLEGINE